MKDIWLEPNILLKKAYLFENILNMSASEIISLLGIFSLWLGGKTVKTWRIWVFDIEKLLQS